MKRQYKMHIGIFTDTYLPDINGVANSVATVKAGLEKIGNKVLIVAPSKGFRPDGSSVKGILKIPSFKYYGEKHYRVALPFFLPKALDSSVLDIVHTQTPFSIGGIGRRLAKRKDLPLVHTYHTRYQEYVHYLKLPAFLLNLITKPVMGMIVSFLNKHHLVVAPSIATEKELRALGVKTFIRVIPTGIDIEKAKELSGGRLLKIPGVLDLRNEKELVVFTSRLAKEKNIGFLIDAMKLVFRNRPKTRLLIIGDGQERGVLENYVIKNGLEGAVVFAGALEHEAMFPIYNIAKVFIFSSRSETQGLVILEAMALGVPVVALRGSGVEDILANDNGGFLLPDGNLNSFAEKIEELLRNGGLRKRKSKEAARRASDFHIKKTAEALLRAYKEAGEIAGLQTY